MDLFAHALAQGAVHELMLLHSRLAAEGLAHDYRLEVMSITADFQVLTVEVLRDVAFYVFRRNQGVSPVSERALLYLSG